MKLKIRSVFKNDITSFYSGSITIRQLKHNCFFIKATFLKYLATCFDLKEHHLEKIVQAVFH